LVLIRSTHSISGTRSGKLCGPCSLPRSRDDHPFNC
jgi:hypothetical protein